MNVKKEMLATNKQNKPISLSFVNKNIMNVNNDIIKVTINDAILMINIINILILVF